MKKIGDDYHSFEVVYLGDKVGGKEKLSQI